MKEFLKVVPLAEARRRACDFEPLRAETVALRDALGRVTATAVAADEELPPFARATMDGFAVVASTTYGASESNPALLTLCGEVAMGERPTAAIVRGDAIRIATGGALPEGADAVVMVEHTDLVGETQIEVTRSLAPGDNVLRAGEDAERGQEVVARGIRLRPQELGVLAALGHPSVGVVARPRVAILSTGDEIVPIEAKPVGGQIRDVNGTTLGALVAEAGCVAVWHGIVADELDALRSAAWRALAESDAMLISGGSSVGVRDFTEEVLRGLPGAELLLHGVAVKPGKPTLLARAAGKPVWGLPGQVTSAMLVFAELVRPSLEALAGLSSASRPRRPLQATLTRNVPSVHGRTDLVRVKVTEREGSLWATPVLGPSGLLRTMIEADGYVAVEQDVEGLYEGADVWVTPL